MFSKILIANRGEIAVRVIRACREMGISTVAVYSEADRDALHVSLADECYCIGPARAKDSYLNMSAILSAAAVSGAQAIHPGYGLLSENAEFARLCAKCGVSFIGPSPEVLSKMGDKDEAKRTMKAASVPVIPGSGLVENPDGAKLAAAEIGYPLLVKARAGGGGRGIRLIRAEKELDRALSQASEEAESAFGDGGMYLEKYMTGVKHIEMQVLCDTLGNIVCLGERDCSMQRKNQKVLEESPSPAVSSQQREELSKLCERAMRAVGYTGAGTVEFLMDRDGRFYFMEMNTRLQVEHPVTEMVTGIDLVKWQIRIASGLPLDFTSKDIPLCGHAIECRINAENPKENFRPGCGKITLLHIPGGPSVRFDTALYPDYVVTPFYDSMIGKLIVQAKTREEAVRKMQAALCELVVEGVDQNVEFLLELLQEDAFQSGRYTTSTLTERGRL
ncbi:acetyl-CoA carboxylase biotin carboxylase subunit [Caproiciproducens sp. NJN-50]|uniref:acetyl-CoA carboxylase biotin carboxylase subunit n=1 Tax=Acutalibacteraceae TaxID=3082771 RepID=UPI000FFE15AD|nr:MULTISPECIES: acetyl-CoA carboxylase biotin carboxylase subunit [Acutalibacteraceae]QAT49363.1 acetyl-CoA carboxylase biotin carboxylase subunit [Caproiciproducens sp. NJN-50]